MRRLACAVAMVAVVVLYAAGAEAGTDVVGQGNTLTGSDSSGGGTSTSGGTTGSIPPGMMAVQVPSVLGGGQYCLVTILVPIGTVLPPYNPISTTMTQVPCPANATPP